jgi:hypothetical protein
MYHAVSEQRLGKHVPVAMQQTLNNTTVALQQWKSGVFIVVLAEMLQKWTRLELCFLRASVKKELEPAAEE